MARKKLPLEEDKIKRIEVMAGLGLTVEQMAAILEMSKKTFERRMKDTEGAIDALEKGRALASLNVTQAAYKMATSGKQPAMTMFWLKCRERWREVNVHELTGAEGKAIEVKDVSQLSDDQLNLKIQALLEKEKKE